MHSSSPSLPREQFQSHLAWARAEYARIQQQNHHGRYPRGALINEPGEKSALFARLLSGKAPLPFPPPTSFAQPWYDIIEEAGRVTIHLGGTLPAWDVPNHSGTVFLEYLIINTCPWGVVNGNEAAATLSDLLGRLRSCKDRNQGQIILDGIGACLLQRPEWVVRFDPWPDYRVFLGRARHQGKRREIENVPFFRHRLDGTNLNVTRVLIDGGTQLAGKAERLARLRDRPMHELSPYERQALASLQGEAGNPAEQDWVEYECDTWMLEAVDPCWQEQALTYSG